MFSRAIALDFDGVLHDPDNLRMEYVGREIEITGENLFCHTFLLAELLRPYPDVGIVISSSWKNHFTLEQLIERLGALGARVMCSTAGARDINPWCACRYDEIEATMQKIAIKDWVAIDDQPEIMFGAREPGAAELEHIIYCESKAALLTPSVEEKIQEWLGADLSPQPGR